MSPAIGKLLSFCYRRAWLVWMAAIFLAVLGAWQARGLRLNVSAEGLVPEDSPLRASYTHVEKTFGSDLVVAVYVEDPELFSVPKLKSLQALLNKLSQIPAVERTDSLFNVTSISSDNGAVNTGPILDPLPATPAEAAAAVKRALSNPILVGNLIAKDGHSTLLSLYLKPEEVQKEDFDTKFTAQVNALIDATQNPANGDVSGRFTQIFPIGSPVMHVEIAKYIFRDQLTLLPLACVILLTLLGLMMRSFQTVIVLFINAVFANCWTLGLMAVLGIPLNMLNYVVPALVVMIGSGSDVHLLIGSAQQRARGLKGLDAITEAGRLIGLSLLLNTGTTVLGFASTTLTNISMLREFGISAALAISLRFCTTMLVLPAYLRVSDDFHTFWNRRRKKSAAEPEPVATAHPSSTVPEGRLERTLLRPYMRLVLQHLVHHPVWVVLTCVLITIISTLFALRIRLDNDFAAFLHADSPVMLHLNTVSKNLAGTDIVDIAIEGNPGEYRKPERLAQLFKFENEYLRNLKDIDSVTGLPDIVALVNREFHDGDPAQYNVPANPQLLTEYFNNVLNNPADLQPFVTPDFSEVNIVLRCNLHDTTRLNQLVADITATLESGRFGAKIYSINGTHHAATMDSGAQSFTVTGHAVLAAASVDSIASGQVASLSSMVAILAATVAGVFLSWRAAVAAIVANLTPIAIVFAVMGLAHVPLNLGTCMIAAISIGMAVDNTINLMVRYHDDQRRLHNESLALADTMRAEFKPIILSGLSMAGGFLALSTSSFVPMQEFGLLSALVMLLACAGDLVVTSSLLSTSRIITVWGVLDVHVRRALLRQSPVFEGFTNWQARKLIAASGIEEHPAGHRLISDGATGDRMYVVLEGELEVTKGENYRRFVLNRLGPGQIIGEVALVAQVQRTADVTALTPVKLLSLDWPALTALQRFSPLLSARLNLNLARILGLRLADTLKKTQSNAPFTISPIPPAGESKPSAGP